VAQATIRVENPNPFPIRLSKVSYDVVLDQRVTGHGETASSLEIPGHGTAEAPVWMRAPIREAMAAAAVLMLMGEVPYELRMTAYLWTPLKDVEIPVSDEGVVKMQDLLPPGLGR
jgi:LEA14-like dessication related protein